MRTTIRSTSPLAAAAAMVLLAGLTACGSTSTPGAGSSTSAASSSAAAGSAKGSATGSASGSAATVTPSTGTAADLEGLTLVATEVTGAYTIVPGSKITLSFDNGSLAANAGCNTMVGKFTVEGNVLKAPQLATTLMACLDPAVSAQETWFAGFLASSPTWSYENGVLTLTNGTDTIAFSEAPSGADALKAVPGWRVEGLISITKSANTVSAVDPSLTPWVAFKGNEVAFDNSCNTGGGTVDIGESTMTFGPLHSTLKACDGPSGTTGDAMSAVLQGTATYTLKDDSAGSLLTIMSEDGTSGLQLTPDQTLADPFAPAAGSATATSSS